MVETISRIISLSCLLQLPVLWKFEHSSLIQQVKYYSYLLVFKGACPLISLLREASVFLILGFIFWWYVCHHGVLYPMFKKFRMQSAAGSILQRAVFIYVAIYIFRMLFLFDQSFQVSASTAPIFINTFAWKLYLQVFLASPLTCNADIALTLFRNAPRNLWLFHIPFA